LDESPPGGSVAIYICCHTYISSLVTTGPYISFSANDIRRHARYIADLLYDPVLEDKNAVFEKGHFLNQKLLDSGLALPMPG